MQVLIDTNIYLNFFRNSTETLASLKELLRILKKKRGLTLLIPEQIKQEYLRDKDIIMEETRTILIKQKEKFELGRIPPAVTKWKEIKSIRKGLGNITKIYRKLIDKYDVSGQTDADSLITKIFKLGKYLDENESIIKKAERRFLKGNPPRKNNNSYGDAIIWETILNDAYEDDLAIVSADGDFKTIKQGGAILNTFLNKEWSDITKKEITLYTTLGEFINSFEDKQTIEKDIIEEEKSNTLPQFLTPQFSVCDTVSSTFATGLSAGININNDSYIINPRVSSSHLNIYGERINEKKIKYCPFCGKDIDPSSTLIDFSITYTGGIFSNLLTCPNCKNSFNPNIL